MGKLYQPRSNRGASAFAGIAPRERMHGSRGRSRNTTEAGKGLTDKTYCNYTGPGKSPTRWAPCKCRTCPLEASVAHPVKFYSHSESNRTILFGEREDETTQRAGFPVHFWTKLDFCSSEPRVLSTRGCLGSVESKLYPFWLTAFQQRRENPERGAERGTFSRLNKGLPLTLNQGTRERRETSLHPYRQGSKEVRGLLL
jgi:hypothetical protein